LIPTLATPGTVAATKNEDDEAGKCEDEHQSDGRNPT
jgi:hypothetical protein